MMIFHSAVVLTLASTVHAQDQEHLSLLQISAVKSSFENHDCGTDNSCHGCSSATEARKTCVQWGTDHDAKQNPPLSWMTKGHCYGWLKFGTSTGSNGDHWTKWQWNGVWDNNPYTDSNTPENTGEFECNPATFGGVDPFSGLPKICLCCGSTTRPCQVGEDGCPKEMHKAQEDNLNFKCANIPDAEWAARIDTRVKKKTKEERETARAEKENFSCDLCEHSENEFNPKGKRGKCQRIHDRAQKNAKRCKKRQGRVGVIRGCCPNPPVECNVCPDGFGLNADNLDGKCAKIATRATKNEELCNKIKGRKGVQRKCCEEGHVTVQDGPTDCPNGHVAKENDVPIPAPLCKKGIWQKGEGWQGNRQIRIDEVLEAKGSATTPAECLAMVKEQIKPGGKCEGFNGVSFTDPATTPDARQGLSCWCEENMKGYMCSDGTFRWPHQNLITCQL
jgi:hypothetical protein